LKVALNKISTQRKRYNEQEEDETKQFNFEALNQINDPQGYGEKVFNTLKNCKFGFEFKIRIMSLIARLICTHNLLIEPFYSYMQKYAQPHQQHITQILAILSQSCHSLVSPDILEPVLMSIVNNFISDRRPNEVIAIGLNTVREICMRCPLVMRESLLKDLVLYRKSKDKGVMMAARSIVTLFRLVNPSLLPKKERGKFGDINIKPLEYGEVHLAVPGIELLDEEISSEDNWGEFEEDLNDFEEVNEEDPNLLEKVDEGKIINDNVTEGKEISMEVDEVREGNLSDFEEISEEDSNEFKEVDEGDIERKINDDTEKKMKMRYLMIQTKLKMKVIV